MADEKAKLDARSKEIDAELAKDARLRAKIKDHPHVLVLGSGDSGKTTFLKQLKILHGGGYGNDERNAFRRHILDNISLSATALVAWAGTRDFGAGSDLTNRIVAVANHFQTSKNTENSMPKSVAMDIEHIWADETVKAAVAKAAPGELVLQDMADFFLSQAVKLSDVNYVPTDQDILNLRVPTTQITETVFKIDGKSYHFFDVAGQQKYRKRWAPYFDTVHNILFLISLAAYDQMLAEDPAVNRMTDAINLFSDICNNELLKKIPVTLFMNKKDLFEKKMATSDIALYFPDYAQIDPAKRDFKRAVRFFEKKFSTAAKSVQANRIFDSHVTCCTDTNVMKTVIHSVIDSIIRTTMRDVGIA